MGTTRNIVDCESLTLKSEYKTSFTLSKALIATIITTWWTMTVILGCTTSAPEDLTFDLQIQNKTLDVKKIETKQGDTLTLNILSDEAGIIHIHGYDYEDVVSQNGVTKLVFDTNLTGKFNITFHIAGEHDHGEHDTPIGSLEVYPR